MKFKLREGFLILILIIVFIVIGFFRDAVFMNLNSQLYKLYFKNYEYTLPNWLSVFEEWPYMKLYYFKYVLTAIFVVLYFLLSLTSVFAFSGNKKNIKWVFYAYGIVLFLSLLTYIGGYALNNFPKGFLFTRNLMGLLQSPFIVMIIIPALKLEKKAN
ncbi:MAG TPA: hypothetical protein PK323_03145 [Bacteroidia bacterium]|nr:hypothetical protein [Bacteroidia bacterium]